MLSICYKGIIEKKKINIYDIKLISGKTLPLGLGGGGEVMGSEP